MPFQVSVANMQSLQTTAIINMSKMSQNEEIFEAAREFRPNRWEKGDSGKISPFSSTPFGFGPRGCYGQSG